jgi:hypothetical protein
MNGKVEAAYHMGRDFFDYVAKDGESARAWNILTEKDPLPLGEFQSLQARYEWVGLDMRKSWRQGFNAGLMALFGS